MGVRAGLWAVVFGFALIGCSGEKSPFVPGVGGTKPGPSGTLDAGAPVDGGLPADGGVSDGGLADGGVGPDGGGDWAQYRGNLAGTWENPGTFTLDQAAGVTPLWTADLGPYGYTQPMIVEDTVYVTTGFDARTIALDAHTGAVKWTQPMDYVFSTPCSPHPSHPGFFAAPAVVGGVVYVASPDGNLYALSAGDGGVFWKSKIADPTHHEEFVQSSPTVDAARGKIYLGVASAFGCDPVQGRVLSVDLSTHAALSVTLTGVDAGAPVWSSLAVDSVTGRVFVTTGDSANFPLATVPLSQAFVALDPNTLQVLDHWQDTGPVPAADSDFGASPTLFSAADGTPLVAAANKDGWLYVLARANLSAGPVWKYQLAMPGDPVAGLGSLVAPTFTHGLLIAAGGQTLDGGAGSVLGMDPGTGQVRWSHTPPGYVLAAMPALGDVLIVASTAPGNATSSLELLDISTGHVLKTFTAESGSFAAPSVGRGLILWTEFSGRVHAFAIPPE